MTETSPHGSESQPVPAADGKIGLGSAFDERYKESFHGLAYIGALSGTFEWLGHKFVIRTLNVDRELAIAALTREWENTAFYQRAYMTAIAALCVQTVDGQGLPVPIGEEEDTYAWARQRFDFVKARWWPPTVDKVYTECLALEDEARRVLDEMGKALGQEVLTPGLSVNSDTWSAEGS